MRDGNISIIYFLKIIDKISSNHNIETINKIRIIASAKYYQQKSTKIDLFLKISKQQSKITYFLLKNYNNMVRFENF